MSMSTPTSRPADRQAIIIAMTYLLHTVAIRSTKVRSCSIDMVVYAGRLVFDPQQIPACFPEHLWSACFNVIATHCSEMYSAPAGAARSIGRGALAASPGEAS
jgi:hypothetical protein